MLSIGAECRGPHRPFSSPAGPNPQIEGVGHRGTSDLAPPPARRPILGRSDRSLDHGGGREFVVPLSSRGVDSRSVLICGLFPLNTFLLNFMTFYLRKVNQFSLSNELHYTER